MENEFLRTLSSSLKMHRRSKKQFLIGVVRTFCDER